MTKMYMCKNCKAKTDKKSMLADSQKNLFCPNCRSCLIKVADTEETKRHA